MSFLERRLESLEHQLAGDEPQCILVTYTDDQPGQEPQPLSPEQIERARELFKQAVEADPEAPYHVITLNSPA